MKKKMLFLMAALAFMVSLPIASALTEYKYDGWQAGDGYGSKTKVDENITNLKGEYSTDSGMYQAPFSKAGKNAKLVDGITEEVHVGLDFDTIANGEFFDVSLALKKTDANGGETYVSEAVVATQREGDKIRVTAGWAPNFKAYVTSKGVYTYQWKMWIEGTGDAKKTYVQFTLIQGKNEIATTGKIDMDSDALKTSDTLNPIAEQENVTVKYLWFCSLNVARGVNVYTEVPTVNLTFVSPLEDEEDEVLEVYKYMSFSAEEVEDMINEMKAAAKEEGYKFEGFYADEAFTTEFDFTKPFEADTKVYTKLTKITNDESGAGNTGKKAEDNPKTSDINLALILGMIALGGAGAFVSYKKKNSKANN